MQKKANRAKQLKKSKDAQNAKVGKKLPKR